MTVPVPSRKELRVRKKPGEKGWIKIKRHKGEGILIGSNSVIFIDHISRSHVQICIYSEDGDVWRLELLNGEALENALQKVPDWVQETTYKIKMKKKL